MTWIRASILLCVIGIGRTLTAHAEVPHPCSANVGHGPLNLRGQSFFHIQHTGIAPSAPSTLHSGKWEVQLITSWVNQWAISEGRYFIDNETLQIIPKIRYGLMDNLQVGIEVPFLWRGGGVMDGLIDQFHQTFGFSREGRGKFPRNRFRVELDHKDGSKFVLDDDDAGIGIQDIVISSQVTFTCGGVSLPATALSFLVSLPTGQDDKLFGSGGIDFSLVLLLAKRLGHFYIYLNGGYTRLGKGELGSVELRKDQWMLFSGLEYRLWKKTSLILQNLINSAAARDFFEFSGYTDEISWGVKTELSPGLILELALIEGIINLKNTPDFGVHAGLTYRF